MPLAEENADLALLDIARLAHIQTHADWMIPRTHVPYCFRCLVLNPPDVAAPRWKRTWLDPAASYRDEHREPLETAHASTTRHATNMEHLLAENRRSFDAVLVSASQDPSEGTDRYSGHQNAATGPWSLVLLSRTQRRGQPPSWALTQR
jgi:hypothetical protein